jgi:hypothetical protein
MKYRAPEGVTALSCAGETIAPDKAGVFEAAGELADELSAHGCVAFSEGEIDLSGASAGEKSSRGRSRAGKAN